MSSTATFLAKINSLLEDVENGRRSLEDCLRQYPAHAEELRSYIEIHERLSHLQRPDPSARTEGQGRQRLLTALASYEAETAPRRMLPDLLSSAITRVIAGALASAILLIGATAAMGGPNVPGQALSALGLSGDHDTDSGHGGSASPTTTTSPTLAPSTVDASTTPDAQALFGLCNAWPQGSANGQANRQDATRFKDLIKAAGAGNKTGNELENAVRQFCDGVSNPGGKPPQPANKPNSTPGNTAGPTSTPDRGNNGNGAGNGNGNVGGNGNGNGASNGNGGDNGNSRPSDRPAGTPAPPASNR